MQTLEELTEELKQAFEGQFMQPDITFEDFIMYEDEYGGTVYVPADCYDEIEGVETELLEKHFGARLSAPGYLDCTEWCAFKTEEEAMKYLLHTYGYND